jgi:plastocyanin
MVQRRGRVRLRAVMGLLGVGAMIGYVGVAGAAEQQRAAAPAEVKTTVSNTWAPPDVAVTTGESVTWNFDGSTASHNVKGETGPTEDPNWQATASPFLTSGQYSYTFTQPGTYTFICQAHPATMKGSVTVTGSPVTPTPTSSATPSPSPSPSESTSPTPLPNTPTPVPTASSSINTPAPQGLSRADTVAPAISKLSLKARKGSAKLSFALSEPASVTIRVKKGKKTLGTIRLAARAGSRSLTLRRLARGSYRVEIEARDARGNKAAVQRKTVKVKR